MTATEANDQLSRLMREAGLSRKAFARAVRDAGAERSQPIACDHTSVARWLAGMMPRPGTASVILDVLSARLRRPLTPSDAGFADPSEFTASVGVSYAATVDEAVSTAESLWRADVADRRELVTAAADTSAWSDVPLTWLLRSGNDGPPMRSAGPYVGGAEVTAVTTMAATFARMDNEFGGGHGRRALIHYLHTEVGAMLRGRYTDATGRRLFQATAEATLLAAWMSYDAGMHGLAQRYFIQALRLADTAGDVLLSASVLDAMSHQATFLGRFHEAANLARVAANGSSGKATPTLRAHFWAMEARAYAGAGDGLLAARALSAAVVEFEKRRPDDEPEWIRYVDQAELDAEFAHCFRDLGLAIETVTYAERSLRGADGVSPRSDVFVSVVHAEGLLRQGEIDEACLIAARAIADSGRVSSARCEAYVAALIRSLERHSSVASVRELMDTERAWQIERSR